jgi:hypothetical protein
MCSMNTKHKKVVRGLLQEHSTNYLCYMYLKKLNAISTETGYKNANSVVQKRMLIVIPRIRIENGEDKLFVVS